MKLYVKVIAFSEEDGIKVTKEEVVEIPAKVQRLNEAVMGKDPHELLEGFAVSAFIAALGTVTIGAGSKAQEIVMGNTGGPIGGRGPVVNESGKPSDPLAAALGLDIIEAMDAKGGGGGGGGPAFPRGETRQRGAEPALPVGPGPIGFGPHRGR